jgi:hypothetical protein
MSKEYDNTNTFVLFKQDVDEGSNKPLFTGTANMGGKEMRAAVWVNKDAKGNTRLNGKFSEFQPKEGAKSAPAPASEEVPF